MEKNREFVSIKNHAKKHMIKVVMYGSFSYKAIFLMC